MKVDIGFFNINGNYIEDIQELNEIERKEIMETKNYDEFFDELNDMANFKNFGKQEETEQKEIIIDGVDVAGCEHYCEKLNTGSGFIQNTSKQGFCLHNITGLQNADIYFRVLSFPKCREQSNCYYKQLKQLQQENAELKAENERWKETTDDLLKIQYTLADSCKKYSETLQEIKAIAETHDYWSSNLTEATETINKILDLITKVEEE